MMVNQYYESEKPHLEQLLELMGEKEGTISPPSSDPPDLCLQLHGKTIGVEHTRLVVNSLKSQDKEIRQLLSECKTLMSKSYPNDIMIRVEPNSKVPITRKRREKLIPLLVEQVISNVELLENKKSKILIAPCPEIIHIAGYRRPGVLKWTTDSSQRLTGELRDKQILEPITKKASKISKINPTDFDCFWLLIVVEGTVYSDCTGYKNNGISLDVENPFEKVLLLHEEDNWYQEIKFQQTESTVT